MAAATPSDLYAFLDAHGVAAQHPGIHPAVFRVEEGEEIQGGPARRPYQEGKPCSLKGTPRARIWLVCALGETRIDLEAPARGDRLSPPVVRPRPELMAEVLGVTPGSVTLFALINDRERRVKLVLDAALLEPGADQLPPLTNTATTAISQAGLRAVLKALDISATVVDFERAWRWSARFELSGSGRPPGDSARTTEIAARRVARKGG